MERQDDTKMDSDKKYDRKADVNKRDDRDGNNRDDRKADLNKRDDRKADLHKRNDDKNKSAGGSFQCSLCGVCEDYSYHGRSPRFCRHIVLLEDCFVIQDPFNKFDSAEDKFLVLGGECAACGCCVCQGAACSVYYTKRFCMECAKANRDKFPPEVQTKILL